MCCGSGGNKAAAESRRLEEERQATIKGGVLDVDRAFGGFDDSFYKQREKDFVNFAMPKLGMEARDTERALAYNLANRSLSSSSAARTAGSSLRRSVADAQGSIGDQARGEAMNLRKDVEGQRSNIIAQLQASADPSVASQQALASASMFTAPSTFAPVGGFLNNWANLWLADRVAKETNKSTQGYSRSPNYGIPSAASYSVR